MPQLTTAIPRAGGKAAKTGTKAMAKVPVVGGRVAKTGTRAWIVSKVPRVGGKAAKTGAKAWIVTQVPRAGAKVAQTGAQAWQGARRVADAATRESPRTRRTPVLLAAAAGAAMEYFIDPSDGKRRRHVARDRGMAILRRGGRDAVRQADYAAGIAKGKVAEATPSPPKEDFDDVTLTRKVETEIFRDADAPKGKVSVNAEHGVIYLRGQLDTAAEIDALAEAARQVEGVQGVKNLLHTPESAPQN
jgi:osmotically-inducible protein OsmY